MDRTPNRNPPLQKKRSLSCIENALDAELFVRANEVPAGHENPSIEKKLCKTSTIQIASQTALATGQAKNPKRKIFSRRKIQQGASLNTSEYEAKLAGS